jgi:ADP-ribose pyrophosphatase
MTERQLRPWQSTARRELLDGRPWLRVWAEDVQLPQGGTIEGFYTIEMPDYVMVVALTPDEQVVIVRSYKHGPRRVSISLPAGYLETGEAPLLAAQRELLEETGYVAESWSALGSFVNDGNRGSGSGHLFLARNARQVAAPQSGDHEEMQIDLLSLDDLTAALWTGDVAILSTAAAIGLALAALRAQPGSPDQRPSTP